MNRILSILAILLLVSAVPLLAVEGTPEPRIVDDVVRMFQSGVDDETVLAFINSKQGQYDPVTTDEIIAMTQAGVSKAVINATVNNSNWREGRRDQNNQRTEKAAPDRNTTVVVSPPYPYYGPYYDPWWYWPRLYIGLGGWGYGGGHYGGHRGGGGGGRHGGGGGHGGGRGGGGGHR